MNGYDLFFGINIYLVCQGMCAILLLFFLWRRENVLDIEK